MSLNPEAPPLEAPPENIENGAVFKTIQLFINFMVQIVGVGKVCVVAQSQGIDYIHTNGNHYTYLGDLHEVRAKIDAMIVFREQQIEEEKMNARAAAQQQTTNKSSLN